MGYFATLKKQGEEYNLPVWKLPDVLLVMMALANITIMILTYLIFSRVTDDPRQAVLIVAAESVLIMVIGNVIVESTKKIARSNILKKSFVDIISHQMRTPLVSTKWHLEMLGRSNGFNKKQQEYLNICIGSTNNVLSLFNDLLNMENIEEGHIDFAFEKVDLNKLVDAVFENNSTMAAAKKISLNKKIPRGRNFVIFADEARIKIIIDNLVNNAIKYTPAGGKVDVVIRKTKDQIECQVADNGIGIIEKDRDNIFQKFFRSKDSIKINVEGTGLGLYICKFLANGMNGKLWFQSRENKGTTFFLSFPDKKK